MKNKVLMAALLIGLAVCTACSSTAPANANKTTNTTTTTTTTNTNTASSSNSPANTGNSSASNTNTTSNTSSTSNSGSAAQPGSKQDFTLVNATGVEIDKLYISPHNADDWQEDILGQDTLPSGQSVDIKFKRSETAALWDLRIEDKQGNAIEWENLNLLQISKVTLHYKDGKGTAEVE